MSLTSTHSVPHDGPDYQKHLGRGTDMQSDIVEKYRHSRKARAKYEPDWLVNLEFLAGNHYIAYRNGRILFELVPEDKARRKPRPVYNYLRTEIETLVSYLTRSTPMFCPAANRGDAKSQAAAILGRQLAKYYFLQAEGPELLEEALLWAMVGSMGIWEIGWDPYAGPKVQAPDLEAINAQGGFMSFMPQPGPDGMTLAGEPPQLPMHSLPHADRNVSCKMGHLTGSPLGGQLGSGAAAGSAWPP